MYEVQSMTRMVRKQVYIEPVQDVRLKRKAAELGVTESDLIRQGIDLVTDAGTSSARDEAWNELLTFIEDRARSLPAPENPDSPVNRRWSREEMYEERWNRRLSR
jgi:hypothetical protein